MRSEPSIHVTCDCCEDEIAVIELTTTAKGYDERNVDADLKKLGWKIEDGEDICPLCLEAGEELGEEDDENDES